LLSIGFTLTSILTLLCLYFAVRVFADFGAAFLVARFGPKHIILLGQILFTISSLLFLTLESRAWPLIVLGGVWGASQSCFFIAFDVDFSKIKHSQHAGKELGYVEIMSKIGAIIGPVLGGVVAIVFGPQFIFVVSTVLLMAGLLPLFTTSEPTRTRQKLNYRSFSLLNVQQHITPIAAVHLENTLSIMMWPLFLALFVIPGTGVFIQIGILSSVSVLVAILSARIIGGLVDKQKGRLILRISASFNALLHLFKPLVSTYFAAFGVGISNEIATIGYRLPFFKAYYDLADRFPGYRIVFISVMESFSSLIKFVAYAFLLILSLYFSDRTTLSVAFVIASISSLVIMKEKFKTLR
jgi:MFS family permease